MRSSANYSDPVDNQEQSWLQNPSFSREQAQEIQELFTTDSLLPRPAGTLRERKREEASADDLLSTSSDSEDYRRPNQRKSEKEHKRDRKRHHKHREKEDREKRSRKKGKLASGDKHTLASVKPQTIWLDESGLDPKDAYRLDPKPDVNNLRYTGLYSGDVASYRRNFGSRCLGLGSHQAIEWTDGRTRASKKDGRKEKLMRYFKGGSLLRPQSDVVLQFTRHATGKEPDSSTLPHVEDYLALVGENKQGASEEQTGQTSELTPEMYITRCTADYNRCLLEDPHNVPQWLEFIAFQDQARIWGRLPTSGLVAEETSTSLSSRKIRLALFERKVAIYERALESNPLSVELLEGHMGLIQEIWETEKVVRRWKDLVFQQPNKSRLWLSYIEFCQSRFSSFSTSSLTALYTKALLTLSSIQDGRLKSHRPDPDTPSSLLSIFVLYCNFLRQMGHSEKAVACFQALVEFNLCCPLELLSAEVTFRERVEFFEAFWDSGIPRFGEEGAVGWSSWMEATRKSGEIENQPQLGVVDVSLYKKASEARSSPRDANVDEIDPEISLIAGLPLRAAWLVLEQEREKEGGLPWRPDTSKGESEDDCTDPDRMVLFDDVNSSLFSITDPKLCLQLLLSFLHFLGAPLPSAPTHPPIPHLSFTCLEEPTEVYTAPTAILRSLLLAESFHQLPTTHQLVGIGQSYNSLGDISLVQLVTSLSSLSERHPTASNFTSNVCNQALSLLQDGSAQTTMAQLWVHHELSLLAKNPGAFASPKPNKAVKSRIKTIQKLVKRLLRLESHRNDLLLWNCCALLEYLVGNFSEAVRLYESVLSQYKSGPDCCPELVDLYVCFCGCVIGLERSLPPTPGTESGSKLALHALVCLAEGSYEAVGTREPLVSPGRLLKAKAVYEKTGSPNESDCSTPTNRIVCRTYFEYLTKGLKFACESLDRYTRTLASSLSASSSEERTCIMSRLHIALYFQSRLILHYSLANPIQPAILRATLEHSLSFFPDDGWFLTAYISCEQQSFISGNLRRYFDSHAPKANTPLPWLFAVWAELQRYHKLRSLGEGGGGEAYDEPETGTLHRIGALLRRATESTNGRHCPLLWRLLMKFEVSKGMEVGRQIGREGGETSLLDDTPLTKVHYTLATTEMFFWHLIYLIMNAFSIAVPEGTPWTVGS